MKRKIVSSIWVVAFAFSLLSGCSNNEFGSSFDSEMSLESSINSSVDFTSDLNSNQDSDSSIQNDNKYILSNVEDNFIYSKGVYESAKGTSAKLFTTPISTGVFSSSLTYEESSGEHYLVFNHNKDNDTYYAFGVNANNKLQLSYFNGESLETSKLFDENITTSLNLKIKMYDADNVVELLSDDVLLHSVNVNITDERYVGIYSSSKSTKFGDIIMDRNPFKDLNNHQSFVTTSGSAVFKDNGVQMTGKNNLIVHDDVSLINGSFEVTVNVQESGKNAVGIVFRLDPSNKTSYFKNQVPCYFLHFGITGSLTLAKHIGDGTTESLKYYVTPFFQAEEDHIIRVVLNNGMIHVLLDGNYCFGYNDSTPILGDKIGLCSFDGNGFYKNIKVVASDELLVTETPNLDVVSGNFETYNNLTISTESNSLLVSKNKVNVDGTLIAKIGTIDKHGHGLVFRLSRPNVNNFYQNEEGLSYYFVENVGDQYYRLGRLENGNITYSKKSYVATSIGHGGTVRVVMNGNNIYVYFTDRLVIKYYDENPLTGQYYGYRSTNKYGLFQDEIVYSESTSIDKAEYLIFGHSYTNLWLSYKKDFKELGDSIIDVGIGGARTLHYVTTAEEMATYNPKWGIYWNGINDINADISLSTMPTNIEQTMKTIKEINPDFQCVIIGVNRCTYAKSVERYEQIHQANLLYKELCDKYDWLHYLDVEYLYCNDEGIPQKSWFVDDLHPTLEAYAKVAELIVDVINENTN